METSKKQKGERKDMWRIFTIVINILFGILAIVMWMAIAVIVLAIALAGGIASC
jgi:heme/copper-type cytochrome/quinol oxidase subunit 2